jgi:hypothetical protein
MVHFIRGSPDTDDRGKGLFFPDIGESYLSTRAYVIFAANVGSRGCLQAVGTECGLVGGDCEPRPPLVVAECEPGNPLVCEPTYRCLQAATYSERAVKTKVAEARYELRSLFWLEPVPVEGAPDEDDEEAAGPEGPPAAI